MRIVETRPERKSPGQVIYESFGGDDSYYAHAHYRAWFGVPKQRLVMIFAEGEDFACQFCGDALTIFPAIVPHYWNPILRKSIYLDPKLCLCLGCWEQLIDLTHHCAQVQSGLGGVSDLLLLFDLSQSELKEFTYEPGYIVDLKHVEYMKETIGRWPE